MQSPRGPASDYSKHEPDARVLKYVSVTENNQKIRKWQLQVGREKPFELEVGLARLRDAGALGVSIIETKNDTRRYLWPIAPPEAPAEGGEPINEDYQPLVETVEEEWEFLGTPHNMNAPNVYEVRPPTAVGDHEVWCSAVLTQQNYGSQGAEDTFDAIVKFKDAKRTLQDAHVKDIKAKDIREQSSRNLLKFPTKKVKLEVNHADPTHAKLTLVKPDDPEGHPEIITMFFLMPSPPKNLNTGAPVNTPPKRFEISSDRRNVKSNLTEIQLQQLVSGVVMREKGGNKNVANENSWTFKVGPFNEHAIKLRSTAKNRIMIVVDGNEIVHATFDDLRRSAKEGLLFSFKFTGQTLLQYVVHETNMDGQLLDDSKGTVEVPMPWLKHVELRTPVDFDVSKAELSFDGEKWSELPVWRSDHAEGKHLNCDMAEFEQSYGLKVPHKVNMLKSCHGLGGFTHLGTGMKLHQVKQQAAFELGGIFACCTGRPAVADSFREPEEVIKEAGSAGSDTGSPRDRSPR